MCCKISSPAHQELTFTLMWFLLPPGIELYVVMLCFVLQLRECLEPEVYELFHKKLTEQALIKDPKFLWCCHVSTRGDSWLCQQKWWRTNVI